jgi:hypothetical protein
MAQHAIRSGGDDVHARTYWSDGVWAGLVAGAVFMMLEMILVWVIKGESPWAPPHMMAAMILGEGVLPPSSAYAPFDVGITAAAMAVHGPLSIAYGLVGAWIVHRLDLGLAVLVGAVFGWAIYIVNFLIVAPVLFPWFGMARGGISIFAHVVFGAVLTGSYIALRRRHRST